MIRWGILGPGRIARQFAGAFSVIDSGQIISVHSSNAERAEAFASRYQIPHFTSDLDEFLSQDTLDAVYIAYPHNMHLQAIERCLNAGKHVLCEKPITISSSEAIHVTRLAREKQLFLMEALWTRFLPAWRKVKEAVQSGVIGKLKSFKASFGFSPAFNPEDRLFNPELAGGATWDLGIYPVAMSQFLVDTMPDKIRAEVTRGKTAVDEHVFVQFVYGPSIKGSFTVSLRERLDNRFLITGSEGEILIEEPFWGAEKVVISVVNHAEKPYDFKHDCNGFEYQIRAANQAISQGKLETDQMPWQASIDCQVIMDEILAKG